MKLTDRIDRGFYPGHSDNWDDDLFRGRILRHVSTGARLLDLGAGAGIVEQMNFRGVASQVCGVDLDPRVINNPMLDEGRVSDAGEIPYDDESFDVVYSDNVVEHLADPLSVLQEVVRVLKPGGVFLFKTPNKYHYMPLVARLTSHRFHQFVNRLRGRAAVDTFPTLYRANSVRAIRALAGKSGFVVEDIALIEGRPEYLRFSWPTYIFGLVYERTVNAVSFLAPLRILLIAELRKPK